MQIEQPAYTFTATLLYLHRLAIRRHVGEVQSMNTRIITTKSLAAMALATAMALAPAVAEARAGGGGSFGSRGARTFSAPPSTSTAPRTTAPIQRSMTPQNQARPTQQAGRPATPGQQGGFFGSTLGRGLMAGLLGAGIFGLLSGSGLFGGLGSMSSILGLIIQLGLIYLLVRLAMNFFARRREPEAAGAAPGAARSGLGGLGAGMGGFGGGSGAGGPYGPTGAGIDGPVGPVVGDLTVDEADFQAFERKLAEIQSAYGEGRHGPPAPQRDARNGVLLLRGHRRKRAQRADQQGLGREAPAGRPVGSLARGDDQDFATVAMRFSVVDTIVDRATGAYVSGDRDAPSEVTEVWTFTRRSGGSPEDWKLAALQQAE